MVVVVVGLPYFLRKYPQITSLNINSLTWDLNRLQLTLYLLGVAVEQSAAKFPSRSLSFSP